MVTVSNENNKNISSETSKISVETTPNISSSGDIINNNEKSINYTIPLDQIELTSNPLDDYQRTLFSLVFATDNSKPENNDDKFDVEIKKVEYKSNLVEKLSDLHTLIFSDDIKFEPPIKSNRISKNRSKDNAVRKTRKKLKNMLNGLMYSFPDFNILSNDSEAPADKKNKSVLKLSDTISKKFSLDSSLYPQIFDIDITTNNKINNDTTILTDNTLLNDGSKYSIVQNQIFKKENDLHFEYNQFHIFNRNNSVIWAPNRNFVFVTGIWKLYQDVIYGLSNIGRLNKQNDLTQQDLCEIEFQTVLDDLFPSLPSRFSHNIKRKRSSSESISSRPIDAADNTDDSNKPVSKYVEFHWDKIRNSIRKNLLNRYRNYLIENKQIDPAILRDIEKLPFIQKVRGGYIHIQGTWLPIELARSLCVIFAFPIRYLLIPLFGSEFPKQCEDWYANREQNMTELKAMPLNVVYSKSNGKTGTRSLTISNDVQEANLYSRDHFNVKNEQSLSPKKIKTKDKVTNIIVPFHSYPEPSINNHLLHSGTSPTTCTLPNINNVSTEFNHNIEKNYYITRKSIKSQDDSYLKKESAISFLLNPKRPQLHGNQQSNSVSSSGIPVYSTPHSPLLPGLNRNANQSLGPVQCQSQNPARNTPVYIPVAQHNSAYGNSYGVNQNSMMLRPPAMIPGPYLIPINSDMRPILQPYGSNNMNNQRVNNIPPQFYNIASVSATTPTTNNIPTPLYGGPIYNAKPNIQLNSGFQLQQPKQQVPSLRGDETLTQTVRPYPPTEQFQRPFLYEDSTTSRYPSNVRLVSPSVVVYPSLSPQKIDQSVSPVVMNNQNSIIPNNDIRPGTQPAKR